MSKGFLENICHIVGHNNVCHPYLFAYLCERCGNIEYVIDKWTDSPKAKSSKEVIDEWWSNLYESESGKET